MCPAGDRLLINVTKLLQRFEDILLQLLQYTHWLYHLVLGVSGRISSKNNKFHSLEMVLTLIIKFKIISYLWSTNIKKARIT